MIGRPDISPQVAPKQPQATIIPPRPVADRMAHEMITAINPIPAMPWFGKLTANFRRERRRDPLIRVENEHPLMGRLRNCPILEVAACAILALDDPATEPARDVERAIRRPGIGHEYVIR